MATTKTKPASKPAKNTGGDDNGAVKRGTEVPDKFEAVGDIDALPDNFFAHRGGGGRGPVWKARLAKAAEEVGAGKFTLLAKYSSPSGATTACNSMRKTDPEDRNYRAKPDGQVWVFVPRVLPNPDDPDNIEERISAMYGMLLPEGSKQADADAWYAEHGIT